MDYANGIIEITDSVLGEDVRPGAVVLVKGNGFADSVTVRKIIDATGIIGDEDLRVAGGPVAEVRGNEIVTSVPNPNAGPGMTVLNSRFEPQGRLSKRAERGWFMS